jgi:protease IV
VAGKRLKRLGLIAAGVLVIVGLWFAAFSVWSVDGGGGSDFYSRYDELMIEEGGSEDRIALINLVGEIFSDPEEISDGASDTNIIAQLDQALEDDGVVGVILNLETPGGTVLASDAIHSKVVEVREEGKPVVALMGDVAASGGYYIASGADEIVASPYTWTGSIGVIAMLPNFEKAAGKLGVEMAVLKTGALKDAGSPFRSLTDQERILFQTLIDEAYNGFVDVVSKGRKLDPARIRVLGDGRIYSGRQAEQLGLVDHLGDRDMAFERVKKLAGSPDPSLIRYTPTLTLLEELLQYGLKSGPSKDLLREVGIRRQPGAAYLWLP